MKNFYRVPGLIPVPAGGGGGPGGPFVPSSSINTNWAGTYTGPGGTFVGDPLWQGVNVNDSNLSYDAVLDGTLGNNPQRFGLSGVITPGRVWMLQIAVRTFSPIVLDVGLFSCTLFDSAGNGFTLTPGINLAGLNSSWTSKSGVINGAVPPDDVGVPNSVTVGAGGSQTSIGAHILTTYIQVSS